MMQMNQAMNSVLASLLVLPIFGLGQDGNKGLSRALADSLEVLNQLGEVRQGIEKGDSSVLPKLLELTEGPIMEAPARDEYLVELRRDVSYLQMQVDSLAQDAGAGQGSGQPGEGPLIVLQPGRGPISEAIRELTRPRSPQPDPASTSQTPGATSSSGTQAGDSSPAAPSQDNKKSFEGKGFTADTGRQARLLFKAGQYEEAQVLFAKLGDDPSALYWQARCLEQRKKLPEAIEAYRKVAEHPAAGPLAQQAQHDLDFVQWQQQYQEQRRSQDQK